METYTLRNIQRDEGKQVATIIAANEPVRVDVRAYIVPAGWLEIETDESPLSCSDLASGMVQVRISADDPIPIRFGLSAEIKAWLVSLKRWEVIDKPEMIQ